MRLKKNHKIFIGFATAIIVLITSLLKFIPTKNKKPIESINRSFSKNTNSAPINVTATNGSNAEVSIGDKTVLNQESIKNEYYTDESVTSYGQQGGITARNVTIVKEKKIDFKTNYSIKMQQLGIQWEGRTGFKICPKNGIWSEPFVAVKTEDDSLHTSISDISGFCNPCGEIYINYKNIRMKVLTYGNPVFPTTGILFAFYKMPSEIIFGDWSDEKQQYIYDFRNGTVKYLYKVK